MRWLTDLIARYDAEGIRRGARWLASHFDVDLGDDFDDLNDMEDNRG